MYVLISAVCFSSKSVFVKLAYQYQVDAVRLLFFRMLFSFPVFVLVAVYCLSRKEKQQVAGPEYMKVVMLGFSGYYLSSLFDFIGLNYVSAGLERLILFIYPTMVTILSALFFRKIITRNLYISLGITYMGILLVVGHDVSVKGSGLMTGVGFILLSALMFSIYLVLSDKLVHRFGSVLYTSLMMIASSVGIFVHVLLVYHFNEVFAYPKEVYILSILLALIATVIPAYLMTDGIKKIGARTTSLTASLGPVFTMILAEIFLHEEIGWVQIMGTTLVISGVLFANFNKGNSVKDVPLSEKGVK